MAVTTGQRRLLIVSNVSHNARKWQWLYRWLDDNCVRLGSQMAAPRYRAVSTLKGGQVTKEAFVTRTRYLAKTVGTKALDVVLNLHGREESLKFADGWLGIAELAARIGELGLGHRLRLLYSTACFGGLHAPHLVAAGFTAASGARRVNANGTYDYPTQLDNWLKGRTYRQAVDAANNRAMLAVHDNLARLMGFDDVDSFKTISGDAALRIGSAA